MSIEEAAVKRMQNLKIGLHGREERGVLILYDMTGQRLRVEIGYGLEEYFPDAFIGYLIHDHAPVFFNSGDLSVGLRLMLRILHDRIREAILGDRFDPSPLTAVRKSTYLSGGAGASAPVEFRWDPKKYFHTTLDTQSRAYFGPQNSPEGTYRRYLEWLEMGRFDPNVSMFTEETRSHLSGFPMSKAYFDYILLKEYGKAFKVDVRGDLALLYFTDSPLVPPHFFRRQDGRWQMDIAAGIGKLVNRTGGVYAWDWHRQIGDFAVHFSDKLVNIEGYIRIIDGDNRQFPTRDGLGGARDTTGWTKVHFAAARGQVDEVKKLLRKGEDVDARNAKERTPLYEAAQRGRFEVVKLLVERGAAVNAMEREEGFTPLHVSSERKHIEVVNYLLSRGADVNARNKWDQTPLWQAASQAWHQDAEVAGILLDHGADLHAKDLRGFTPLHIAAEFGHAPAAMLLLAKGANPNAPSSWGSTPLLNAVEQNHPEIVRLLLEHGANINLDDRSPLRIAEDRGHDRIVALLGQYGAKK
jgi:ankyrin repeat protein